VSVRDGRGGFEDTVRHGIGIGGRVVWMNDLSARVIIVRVLEVGWDIARP